MIDLSVNIKIAKLDTADIGHELQRYENAKASDRYDRNRALENFILYAPTGNWQTWATDELRVFEEENRPPNNYNFMQFYVDGNAGNFIANKVDPQFVDASGDGILSNQQLELAKHAWFSDKEHMNYDASHNSAIVNGCIYRGVEEIRIVRTYQEPRGRIAFDSLHPCSITFDQSNLTDDIARGSREAYKEYYLYPKDIATLFEHCRGELRTRLRYLAHQNEVNHVYTRYQDYPWEQKWGNMYQVVERYHIETETKFIAFDSRNAVELPDTPYPFGSEEDWYAKAKWAETKGFTVNPGDVQEIRIPQEVLWVTTFIPGLGLVVENRKDERQIINSQGRCQLPFYTWSYTTKGGKSLGLIDYGKDMQLDINRREAQKTKFLTQTNINGKPFIHPMAHGGDAQKKKEFVENFNDPSKAFEFHKDAPPGMQNLIGVIRGGDLNPAILNDESSKMEMMNKILRLPPAMQGQTGRSGESGVLLGRKIIEGNIMQKVPASALEQYQNYKFEGWLSLAVKLYGGDTPESKAANENRVFRRSNGDKIVVNEVVGMNNFGDPILRNDFSELKRADVIISQAKDNDYMKQSKREVDIAYLNAMPPTETNTFFRAMAEADLAKNMDNVTPDQEDQITEASQYVMDIAKKQLIVTSLTLDQQIQQLRQATGAQGQPAPMPGGTPGPQGGGQVNPEALQSLAPSPAAAGENMREQPIPEVTTPRQEMQPAAPM